MLIMVLFIKLPLCEKFFIVNDADEYRVTHIIIEERNFLSLLIDYGIIDAIHVSTLRLQM